MNVFIAVVITFIVVSLWNLLATRRIRANQSLMIQALIHELDEMSHALNYTDYISYLRATKNEEYAEVAETNITNLISSFSTRGVN